MGQTQKSPRLNTDGGCSLLGLSRGRAAGHACDDAGGRQCRRKEPEIPHFCSSVVECNFSRQSGQSISPKSRRQRQPVAPRYRQHFLSVAILRFPQFIMRL